MSTAAERTNRGSMFISGKTTKSGYAAIYKINKGDDVGKFDLTLAKASAKGGRVGASAIGQGTHRAMKSLREAL